MQCLKGQEPPYVPWSCGFTKEARDKLQAHYGSVDWEDALQNHILKLGSDIGFFTDLGENHLRDVFGVVWDRSIDKDIGNVEGCVLSEPTLKHYTFPDPLDRRFLPIFLSALPDTRTASVFFKSAFRCMSGPGLCAACKTC